MHQCVMQWVGNEIELVPADDSVNISSVGHVYWDLEDFDCFSRKEFHGDFISVNDKDQQPIQVVGSESNF